MTTTTHQIFWWNLENLFDVEDSSERPAWLQKRLKSELRGWTREVLNRKIDNLASVIKQFNDGRGPDIMGVCEIENQPVLEILVTKISAELNRSYKVLHHESNDGRGIDIAVLYDAARYEDDGKIFTLEVMKRNATRDLFQVNLITKPGGNELILIGNHWPSRSGGQYESEPYRIMVGETLSYWIDRIHEIKGEDAAIVVMGDFNDDPYNRSITDYLLATNNEKKIENARSNHYLDNLMYPFLDGQLGTHVYGNTISVLDQFMVSRSIMSQSNKYPFKIGQVEIVHYDGMARGEYNTPIRFGRPSSGMDPEGFSDHFPILLELTERWKE